jgi:hypothetical protein
VLAVLWTIQENIVESRRLQQLFIIMGAHIRAGEGVQAQLWIMVSATKKHGKAGSIRKYYRLLPYTTETNRGVLATIDRTKLAQATKWLIGGYLFSTQFRSYAPICVIRVGIMHNSAIRPRIYLYTTTNTT